MSDFFSKMFGALGGAASAAAGAFTKDPWMQVLSGGISGLFGSFSQDSASKNYLNQQMTLLQNQQNFQREMFDKALQANKSSILDQYAQYAKLGINPLAINSSMSQANVSSPSAPSSPSAAYQSPTELAQIRLADSQAAKNYAEARAIDPNEAASRTALNAAQVAKVQAETTTEEVLRPWKGRVLKGQYNEALVSCEKAYKDMDYLDTQIKRVNKDIQYFDASKFYEFLRYDKEFAKLDAETKAAIAAISREWFLAKWQANVMSSQVGLNEAQKDYIEQQKQTEEYNSWIKEIDYGIKVLETQYNLPAKRIEKELSDFRLSVADNENKRLKIEFDTEQWKNAPDAVKAYKWSLDKLDDFCGFGTKFVNKLLK